MAKLTEEQKAEQKRLKAIPNDGMKAAITGLNEVLKANKMDLIKLEKSKGATVDNLTAAIRDLLNVDKADLIPEDIAIFYNDHIAIDDAEEATQSEEKPKDPPKPRKPRKTKEELKARYDFIESMIKAGKSTKKEIVDATAKKFTDVKPITLSTFIQDCLNEKYNKFDNLAYKDKKGIISFNKPKAAK